MKKKIKTTFVVTILLISIFTGFSELSNIFQSRYNTEIGEFNSEGTKKHISDHPIDIPFVYGARSNPHDLDPQNSWDTDSFNVIQQVCEGLYGYNYSHPETEIIPYLATADGTWSPDGLNCTIPLRSGVTFHDGAPFNASAVKFTFDRLNYFFDNMMSIVDSLYTVYDPDTSSFKRIINRTEIVGLYTIKFVLNVPYGALDALLCFPASFILSPKSTPSTTIIDLTTGDLIGTGPFVYDGYVPDVEVNFHAYDMYWQGQADIDQMKFKIISDNEQRQQELINGNVHFISSPESDYFDVFSALPYLTLLDSGKTGGTMSYLGMNNKQINGSFREAISYAIDYDYIIDEIRDGQASRLKSPVPDGIRYANSTFDYPVLDLPHARTVMQSMGYGVGFNINNDAEWETIAATSPFATFNYSYNIGSQTREAILLLLQDNLAKIGIEVTDAGMSFMDFIYRLLEVAGLHRDMLQLYYLGWLPDFNDPSNYIEPLFTNRSISYNGAQVNDWIVQEWMEEAILEVDQSNREVLYDKIQKRLVEEVYPLAWCTVENLVYAHHINLTGFQPNILGICYFYPCQWDPWYITPRTDTATFKVGLYHGPNEIDPHDTWDQSSFYLIDQVCEGLYGYNYSHPEMEILPYLATADGTWSPDDLNYTVPLRSGVSFHDGTSFNASAVKFSFDRLNYFINATGTLPPSTHVSVLRELYEFRDRTPIINRVEIVDPYTVKFVLNAPYAPFQALLCFSGSYIMSPASTPPTDYIDLSTGDLVGTGPFEFDNYVYDVEVNFHAYNNYWRGKADIDVMKFEIYTDSAELYAALLTGNIDFVDNIPQDWVATYQGYPNITVLDDGKTGSAFYYIGMNNNQINVSFREAISYAIDYDYMIDDLYEGSVSRMKSPIPEGLRYANSTFDYPTLDLARARTVMQSMGYGVGFNINNDAEWEAVAATSPFVTFNYTYYLGSQTYTALSLLLQDNLAKIGIEVTGVGLPWSDFLYRIYEIGGYHKNMLQLFSLGWMPDFNDPSNFLDVLFLNTSISNAAQVNDPLVSQWLQDALVETNPTIREMLFNMIQKRLVEEVYPWAWGFVRNLYTAYHEDLTGFQQNALEKLYFYPCTWNRKVPSQAVLSSDAGTPDIDGNFNLLWTASDGAINYTVYQYSKYITTINGSLTPLVVETTDLTLPLSGYSAGTYYFIVVAHNEYGDTLSNCISVEVSPPVPGDFTLLSTAGTPDDDGIFDLVWGSSSNADNYSVYQYDKFITEINGSLLMLTAEITDLTIPLSGYTSGTYFFIVVARNEYGDTLSNCISVEVDLPVPGDFVLLSTAGTPDDDGIFDLVWASSSNADNYTVYQYDKFITEINGSLLMLTAEITDLTTPLSGYTTGTYFFIVVAHNEYGDTLSNCISVEVDLPVPGDFILLSTAGTPDDDGIFDLAWASSSNADNYTVYQYDKYITEINGSLTLLTGEITDLTIPLSGYTSGTYFFLVVAHNEYGDTLSNCITVNVQIPVAGSLTILIPDTTSSWEIGSDHYIYWTSTGSISDITIELYNNDVLVSVIVPSTLNDGEYYWTLSSTLTDSTQYQIRISDVSNPSTYDFSDYFEIKSPSAPPPEPEIPGYNIFLILGLASFIFALLIKKKRYIAKQ